MSQAQVDMVTASSNGYFFTVTEAKLIESVTSLPLQRAYKSCLDYIATVTEKR